MEAVVGFFDATLIDVGIDLGRRNVRVPEHFLDDAQIGAVVEEVGGETVAQRVGRDIFFDTRGAGVFFNMHPDGLAAEWTATCREEDFAEFPGLQE